MCMMTYTDFRHRLRTARLTAREFASLVQMNESSVTNYSQKGVVPFHLAVIVLLMGELADHQIDFRKAIVQLEIERKKPRGQASGLRFGRAESTVSG